MDARRVLIVALASFALGGSTWAFGARSAPVSSGASGGRSAAPPLQPVQFQQRPGQSGLRLAPPPAPAAANPKAPNAAGTSNAANGASTLVGPVTIKVPTIPGTTATATANGLTATATLPGSTLRPIAIVNGRPVYDYDNCYPGLNVRSRYWNSPLGSQVAQNNAYNYGVGYGPVTMPPNYAPAVPPPNAHLASDVANILAANGGNAPPANAAPANADAAPGSPNANAAGADPTAVPVPPTRTAAPAPAVPDPELTAAERNLDVAMAHLRDSLRTRPDYAAAVAEKQAAADATAALRARGEASPDQLLPAARRGLEANQRVSAIEREAAAKDPQVLAARARLTAAVAAHAAAKAG